MYLGMGCLPLKQTPVPSAAPGPRWTAPAAGCTERKRSMVWQAKSWDNMSSSSACTSHEYLGEEPWQAGFTSHRRSVLSATWAAFWPEMNIAPKVGPMRGEPGKHELALMLGAQVESESECCSQSSQVQNASLRVKEPTFTACPINPWPLAHQPPQPPPCRTQSCQERSRASGRQ